ncbi:pentapeptide repeat-containing protein [Micromonospora sp. NPDC050784]|uniref:pentapeptide repeat-containing protein n=1 Tax=Micromonospora sp. NPDC050784 TaxID=3364281 RepID=UPI003791DC86
MRDDAKAATHRPHRPMSAASLMVIAAILITISGVVAYWMWKAAQIPADTTSQSAELMIRKAQLRVDTVRNLLGVFAGTGGIVALFVAIRRQYVQERVDHADQELKARSATDAKHDADERRLTELYVKAADQLGSEKAPVRLASLYALERIGQDNPTHRQTITDLICAYLRMPYDAPSEAHHLHNLTDSPEDAEAGRLRVEEERKRREEREVRLTAQGIIKRRLRRPIFTLQGAAAVAPWEVSLDLSHAILVNFDLSHCSAVQVNVSSARFIGQANFRGLECLLAFIADGATFEGETNFGKTNFGASLLFSYAVFRDTAVFTDITFHNHARFAGAVFKRGVFFTGHRGSSFAFERAVTINAPYLNGLPKGWELGTRVSGELVDIVPPAVTAPQEADS